MTREDNAARLRRLLDGQGTAFQVEKHLQGIGHLEAALARAKDPNRPPHDRPTSEEEARNLESALAVARNGGHLALEVICALARVEELRGVLDELAGAIGDENYNEAIQHARRLRAAERERCEEAEHDATRACCDGICGFGTQEHSMNFGQAIEALKNDKRVRRAGWNGKGMWLVLIHPGNAMHTSSAGAFDMLPCIGMKTAQNDMQPGWNASQPDMLADDWEVVE